MGGLTTNSESWRDAPVSVLENYGLSPSILRALQAAGLDTLGMLDTHKRESVHYVFGQALARRRAPPIFDHPGIGRAASRKIINALGAYRKAHPEPTR